MRLHSKIRLALIVLSVGTASCSTRPAVYERPLLDLPAAAANPLTIERQWWKAFGNPALDDLIEEALANNLDLAKAAANLAEARANAGVARAYLTPRVDSVAGAAVKQRELTFALTDQDFNHVSSTATAGVAVNWEIDLWGRIRQMNDAALARLAASAHARRAVALSISAAVAETWFQLRNLDAKLAITRNAVANLKAIADLEYKRWRAEAGTELNYRKSLAEAAAAEARIPGLEAAVSRTELAIRQLVGRSPRAMTSALPRGGEPALPQTAREVDSTLLLRRPDVASAELVLAAAHADVNSVRAEYYPRLTLSLMAGIIATSSKAISGMPLFWDTSLGLGAPLFDGGLLDAKTAGAKARRQLALANYQYAVTVAFRETYEALAMLEASDRQFSATVQEVYTRRKSLALTQKSLDAGRSSKFDVFSETIVLLNSEMSMSDARLNQLTARCQYYKALGGGY